MREIWAREFLSLGWQMAEPGRYGRSPEIHGSLLILLNWYPQTQVLLLEPYAGEQEDH
jgi:hypothetical protein